MKRVIYRYAMAWLLTANAAFLAQAINSSHDHGRGLGDLLGAVSLFYLAAIVLVYALGAAWHVGNAAGCRWNRRRVAPAPSARTVVRESAVPGRHAAAEAAVAAQPLPLLPDTLRMPIVQAVTAEPATVPYPPLDLTIDLGEYRVYAHGGQR